MTIQSNLCLSNSMTCTALHQRCHDKRIVSILHEMAFFPSIKLNFNQNIFKMGTLLKWGFDQHSNKL